MSDWFAVLAIGLTVGNVALMVANLRLLRRAQEVAKAQETAVKREAVPTRGVVAIDPAEVLRQRAAKWPDFHPETFCHRCGRRNVCWFAQADEWGKATKHQQRGVVDILCPVCFVELYEANAGNECIWEVRRWVPDGSPTTAEVRAT